jgi:hypothetical protein
MEHMSQADKENARANKNPLLTFFGPAETESDGSGGSARRSDSTDAPPTEDEYFAGIY